ncbi:hypothetical protein G6F68_012773 [Rhizopus microsporus]|nr:hypothetical protein G6F68_012773 [Rhizopus microsporus]
MRQQSQRTEMNRGGGGSGCQRGGGGGGGSVQATLRNVDPKNNGTIDGDVHVNAENTGSIVTVAGALAVAVSGKQLETVRVLLAASARADGPNNGFVLLASALPDAKDTRPAAERYALADALIAAGAPLDAGDYNGTPLLVRRISYYSEDKDSLTDLLAKGAHPNAREKNGRSALHAAMGSPSRFWFAEQLLAKGADINAAYVRMRCANRTAAS